MYTIKEKPEDFVVEEVTNVEPSKDGKFICFWLKKTTLNTLQAIEYIAKALHTQPKFINFAGTKDKVAITTQLISIKGKNRVQIEKLKFKDIDLRFFGYRDEPLHLGELDGNKFKIVLRNVIRKAVKKNNFINYFGEQRFSDYNIAIGKSLIKSDFNIAVQLIEKSDSFYFRKLEAYLDKKPNDFVNALKLMPKKLLKLYVNSYQSYMWNETVKSYLKNNQPGENIEVPMIGFGLNIENLELKEIVNRIMKVDRLNFRDFIVRALPDLSAEGDNRKIYMDIKEFNMEQKGKTLNLNFQLGKGSYATEVVRQLFE